MRIKSSINIALLASVILFPGLARAQVQEYAPSTQYGTYQYGAGYQPQANIYDPTEAAGMVSSGMGSVISEAQKNYNLSRPNGQDSQQETQKKKAPDTSSSMGYDLLENKQSVKSVMGDDKTDKKDLPSPDGVSGQEAPKEDNAKGKTPSKNTISANTQNSNPVIKGYARALDTISLSINGRKVILNGLKGPGNGELCYHNGVPWECGEEGRSALERLLADNYITCAIEKGDIGSCLTQDGDNLAYLVAERGYVIGTVSTTGRITHQAKIMKKGIFQ